MFCLAASVGVIDLSWRDNGSAVRLRRIACRPCVWTEDTSQYASVLGPDIELMGIEGFWVERQTYAYGRRLFDESRRILRAVDERPATYTIQTRSKSITHLLIPTFLHSSPHITLLISFHLHLLASFTGIVSIDNAYGRQCCLDLTKASL